MTTGTGRPDLKLERAELWGTETPSLALPGHALRKRWNFVGCGAGKVMIIGYPARDQARSDQVC